MTFRLDGDPAGVNMVLIGEKTGSKWQAFHGAGVPGRDDESIVVPAVFLVCVERLELRD